MWADKTAPAPQRAGAPAAARWGTLLEPVVADEWAREAGAAVRPVGVLAHVDEPWRRASLDRLVDDCPRGAGPCALEVKTRSAAAVGEWADELPVDVAAQVVWQLDVTGLDHVHVAALFGGRDLREWVVTASEASGDAEWLRERAAEVWAAVLAGEPPTVEPSPALVESLHRVHGQRRGSAVDVDGTVAELVRRERALHAAVTRAAHARDSLRADILQRIGPAARITRDDGSPLATVSSATSIDSDVLHAASPQTWRAVAALGFARVTLDSAALRRAEPELWRRAVETPGAATVAHRLTIRGGPA